MYKRGNENVTIPKMVFMMSFKTCPIEVNIKEVIFDVFLNNLYLLKNISFSKDCFSQNLCFVRNYRRTQKLIRFEKQFV
jgi:hypothetical protein